MGRYARGVRSPRPELIQRIREALAADPKVSKTELAKRVGVTRATVAYYLRAMGEAPAHQPQERPSPVAPLAGAAEERRAITHLDLLDQINAATGEVAAVIAELRKQPLNPGTAGAMFRGFGTLERLWRLLGELMGQVSPPAQNLFLVKLDAFLAAPIRAAELPPALRETLAEGNASGPA